MRSHHEWLRLLRQQAHNVAAHHDNLIAARMAGWGEEMARQAYVRVSREYRDYLYTCPAQVLREHVSDSVGGRPSVF